jgi:hypothetical protein
MNHHYFTFMNFHNFFYTGNKDVFFNTLNLCMSNNYLNTHTHTHTHTHTQARLARSIQLLFQISNKGLFLFERVWLFRFMPFYVKRK